MMTHIYEVIDGPEAGAIVEYDHPVGEVWEKDPASGGTLRRLGMVKSALGQKTLAEYFDIPTLLGAVYCVSRNGVVDIELQTWNGSKSFTIQEDLYALGVRLPDVSPVFDFSSN